MVKSGMLPTSATEPLSQQQEREKRYLGPLKSYTILITAMQKIMQMGNAYSSLENTYPLYYIASYVLVSAIKYRIYMC